MHGEKIIYNFNYKYLFKMDIFVSYSGIQLLGYGKTCQQNTSVLIKNPPIHTQCFSKCFKMLNHTLQCSSNF